MGIIRTLIILFLCLIICQDFYPQNYKDSFVENSDDQPLVNTNDRIELKVGLEPVRLIPGACIGYSIGTGEYLSFVPELSFMCGINLSLSLKPQISISNQIVLYSSIGTGLAVLTGKNWFTAVGSEIKLNRTLKLITEFRVIFFSIDNESRTTSVAGYDLVKQRPVFISVGISI